MGGDEDASAEDYIKAEYDAKKGELCIRSTDPPDASSAKASPEECQKECDLDWRCVAYRHGKKAPGYF